MTNPLIHARGVHKRFGTRAALGGVDLELLPGRIMVLAGPNGSGKTTLLRLIAGLVRPTGGTLAVLGVDPWRDRPRIMRTARFAFAPPSWYGRLTARETLLALGRLGADVSTAAVDAALDRVHLGDRAHDRVRTFSFGMRQRLALAQALLPVPRLLVLDEPTDGLDLQAVADLRTILDGLRRDHGMSILLSSHELNETDGLLDDMVLLHEGRVLFRGPPDELRRQQRCVRLTSSGTPEVTMTALNAAGLKARRQDGSWVVDDDSLTLERARTILSTAGLTLDEFHVWEPTLEDAVMQHLHDRGPNPR